MAFRPENPEFPEDLYVLCDPEKDAVFVLYYEPGNELFYRDEGQWKEITEEDEWEFDLDGLIDFNVKFLVKIRIVVSPESDFNFRF